MRHGATVTRLALRELWITFRLLAVLGSFTAAGALVALVPTTPGVALERLGIGFGLAIVVLAALSGWSLAEERASGRAGWLITRSVARGTYLFGWAAALSMAGMAGLAGGAVLGWLAASPPGFALDVPAFGSAVLAVAASVVLAVGIGLLCGALVLRGPAALLAAGVSAVIGVVAVIGGGPLGVGPAAGFMLLPRVPSGTVEGDALRMAGLGLLLAAALLGVVRAVLERAEL